MRYFISGPHSTAIVEKFNEIEPVIHALCNLNGDDPDDYTATECEYEIVSLGP